MFFVEFCNTRAYQETDSSILKNTKTRFTFYLNQVTLLRIGLLNLENITKY